MERVEIETRDGSCPTFVHRPGGSGSHPAVIHYMDGPGLRPAVHEIASRIARMGYVVLLPDLFYRLGGADPEEQRFIFVDPERRKRWIAHYLPSASLANVRSDTDAFLAYLTTRRDVHGASVGATGYCMGGGHAITAAACHPDRVVAAASFHGGGLATDDDTSPHLLAPRLRAKLYVAAADRDPLFPDAMRDRFLAALDDARVDYEFEVYEGCLHGFVPSDTPVHVPAAAERHFAKLEALFRATLPPAT